MIVIIISLISLIIAVMCFVLLKRRLDASKSTYFYLKLKELEIEYKILKTKNSFRGYEELENNILSTLNLIRDKNSLNLRQIRLAKPKIAKFYSKEEMKKTKKYMHERSECSNEEVLSLFKNTLDIKEEIIKYRFPIKGKVYLFFFILKMRILLTIALIVWRLTKRIRIRNMNINDEVIDDFRKNKDDFPPVDGVLLYAH